MKTTLKNFLAAISLILVLFIGAAAVQVSALTHTLQFVQTPTITLYSSISASATSARVTPYPKDLNGTKLTISDFGSSPTFTIDPKVKNVEEILGFTGITDNGDNTATLTGLTRNLISKYPYTTAGTGRQHAASAIVVFSNNPQMYARFAAPENDQTWSGIQTFSSTTQPVYDGTPTFSNPLALINKAYADALSIVGAPTSTFSGMGVVWLATRTQTAAGTASSTTGAPLAIPNKNASSTYNGSTVFQGLVTALRSTFDIDPNFIATSSGNNYSWGGTHTFSGTINITGTPTGNGFSKFGGTGADGALAVSSGTTTIDLGGATQVIKNYTSISVTSTGHLAFVNASSQGTVVILRSQGNVTLTCALICIDATSTGAIAGTGGATAAAAGTNGTQTINIFDGLAHYGAAAGTAGVAYTNIFATSSGLIQLSHAYMTTAGNGGGGGTAGTTNNSLDWGAGGAAGRGAGTVIIEVQGALNFTTTNGISVAGVAGTVGLNGSQNGGGQPSGGGGGGGGGGSGGAAVILYNTLTANSGTINVAGGAGGAGGTVSGGAAGTGGDGGVGGGGAGFMTNKGTAGTAGSAHSGAVGGAGGAGGAGANGYSIVMQNTVF